MLNSILDWVWNGEENILQEWERISFQLKIKWQIKLGEIYQYLGRVTNSITLLINLKSLYLSSIQDFLPLIFEKQIKSIIINYLHRSNKIQMHNMINQATIASFIVVPSIPNYFTFVPFPFASSENLQSPETQFTPFVFSPQIDLQFYGKQYLQFIGQSSNNLQQKREVGDAISYQTNVDAVFNERGETHQYTPIILSHNSESDMSDEKEEQIIFKAQQKKYVSKQQKGKGKIAKMNEDKDYSPKRDKVKKQTPQYQENDNRNIIPNEINQIFSFLQKKNKSGHIVDKLFNKLPHNPEFTPKRYYLYQSLLKNKLGHYTNQNSLRLVTELYEPKCESWSENEQRFYNKISRVLIRHFLHQDSIFMILTSKRMKSNKKSDHIRARHQVKQSVLKILKGY